MKRFTLVLFILFGLLACGGPQKDSTKEAKKLDPAPLLPLEDFFKNPEKTNYKLSPDGSSFSFLAPYEKRMNIFVQKVGETEATRLTSETDRDIAGYFWANNDRLLYLRDTGGDENFRLYGVNTDGSNLICFTDFENVRTGIIDDLPEIPEEVIISMNKRNPQVFDPYRLNINTGVMNLLAENPGNITAWMTDHEGKLRLAIATDGVNQSYMWRDNEKDEFKTTLTTSFKETVSPLFFTFDNKQVYALCNLERDKQALVIFDMATGKEAEKIFEAETVDLSGANYSRKRKVLLGTNYYTDKRHDEIFDEEAKATMDKLEAQLPGVEIRIASNNKAEDLLIIRTFTDKSRGAYYLYDVNTDELTLIENIGDWLNKEYMAAMKPISYQSRDGLTINGYLTLPQGVEAKNLPVVINPHGGPWARDYWGFNPEVQFLANRGYAVLQMNFRGSTGYGKEFWQSSFKEWGKTMQNDISDGVQWLIDQEIADPQRVGIYGGSYGGYATLAGLTFTPELYACGVDYVGVSNIFTLLKTIPPYWEPIKEMFHEMVGDPVKDSLLLHEVSPVFHADNITAPLLVAQGANDPRVNKAESDQIVEALQNRGIAVEYLVKDNEGHGFRNEENRFDFYRSMESFLASHLGGRKAELQ